MDNQSIYITASELAQVMGVSNGHAYKLIREMNTEHFRYVLICRGVNPQNT